MADIVAWHERQGMTPDEIGSHYPSISLGDVHAALAYYFDHLDEIRQEMGAARTLAEELRQSYASLLEAKLRQDALDQAS